MTNNKIATRGNIAAYFATDEETTHRILMNTNWGFFVTHFGSDAQNMWDEAHPFQYPAHPSKDYTSFSIDFIEKYFTLFANNQFWAAAGWEFNPKTNKMDWVYTSGYKAA